MNFNIFSKKLANKVENNSSNTNITINETIEEIHNAFDIAGDLAIKEAKNQADIALKDREIANNERSQEFEEIKHNSELYEKEKDRELKREELKSKEKIAKSKPKPTAKKK